MLQCAVERGCARGGHPLDQLEHQVAGAQAVHGREDVVAASTEVDPAAHIGAGDLDQVGLVVEVGVLAPGIERHRPGAFGHDAPEGRGELAHGVLTEQALVR